MKNKSIRLTVSSKLFTIATSLMLTHAVHSNKTHKKSNLDMMLYLALVLGSFGCLGCRFAVAAEPGGGNMSSSSGSTDEEMEALVN